MRAALAAAAGAVTLAIVALWPSTSDPTYTLTRCHLSGVYGKATYVALAPINPTPTLPDYQAPRATGDIHPCGI